MITLLTFSAALNTSLELAAEGGGEEYDDIDSILILTVLKTVNYRRYHCHHYQLAKA